MDKIYKWIVLLALVLALSAATVRTIGYHSMEIENLAAVASAGEGNTAVALYNGSKIDVHLVDREGTIHQSFSIPGTSGGESVQIADLAIGEDGTVYYLLHYADRTTGALSQRQELEAHRWRLWPWDRKKTIPLDGSNGLRYSWLDLTTSLMLTAVDADGVTMQRAAYELDSFYSGKPVVKAARSYPVAAGQGVYSATVAGSQAVYISRSGKIFLTGEDLSAPTQLYPKQDSEFVTSYALFVERETAGSVVMGEQKSGNIYRLYTDDGRTEFIGQGDQGLGNVGYNFADLLEISFSPEGDSFTAPVQNAETSSMELVVSQGGGVTVITGLRYSALATAWYFFRQALLIFVCMVAVAAVVQTIVKAVSASRTILLKLSLSSIPLMVVALVLFGLFTYNSYYRSLSETYATKLEDQGDLLRALFGSESFDSITSPDRYNTAEYSYIKATMDTRDVYTSSAYFVERRLYTGVDEALPCLYPYAITGNRNAYLLYRQAALSGQQRTGIIRDGYGERIACITPVGSSSGDTVFLLETSVFTAEIGRAITPYIRSYLLVAGLCILATSALLLLAFTRILDPLRLISAGLEQFSKGDRSVRIAGRTNDELADISRVFNKMAGDIDVQIYNLRNITENYYRFIPQQVFRLLGKESLGELQLGSSEQGRYSILCVDLSLDKDYQDFAGRQALTNTFFSIVNKSCDAYGATLLVDGIDLRRLIIVCPEIAAAVKIAFDAIAQVDSHNAREPLENRMEASFFLHHTEVLFAVFGDDERYIPALLSAEMNTLLQDSEQFRRMSSRLIVTDAAYGQLEAGAYAHRFIGYAAEEAATGLYDFYDSCPPTMIRLFNQTQDTFNKAMELYQHRRYYDAKNLLALVLRENQFDNVARYYIFQCERRLGQNRTGK